MPHAETVPAPKNCPPGSAPALDRGLEVPERLSCSTSGLTSAELSEQPSLPENSVFRLTQALLARGYFSRLIGDLP